MIPSSMRTAVAVVIGYLANALLIAATEALLEPRVTGSRYYAIDIATQCVWQLLAGYICAHIVRAKSRTAVVALIVLGLVIGGASLVASWRTEPHWYGIALLLVYAPCVWLGYLAHSKAANLG